MEANDVSLYEEYRRLVQAFADGTVGEGDRPLLTIGVTTAPRAGADYLPQTLEALATAYRHALYEAQAIGPSAASIYAEPDAPVPAFYEPLVYRNEIRLGNWHNWKAMAKRLADEPVDYVLTVEDDVLLHPTAIATGVSVLQDKSRVGENAGFLSLYVSGKYQRDKRKQPLPAGLYRIRTERLWGACAWLFPKESLEAILAHPLAESWRGEKGPDTPPEAVIGVDIVVGKILNDLGRPMYFLQPALAQHIGEKSTVGNDEGLKSHRRSLDVQE